MTVLEQPIQVPISKLAHPMFDAHGINVQMLHLERTDPLLNGNKPFKLFPNIELARSLGYQTMLSFGGAWSNHIHALAEAGRRFGFSTIGVIRGDDGERPTQTLNFARSCGMTLLPVSRLDYRRRHTAEFIDNLKHRFGMQRHRHGAIRPFKDLSLTPDLRGLLLCMRKVEIKRSS